MATNIRLGVDERLALYNVWLGGVSACIECLGDAEGVELWLARPDAIELTWERLSCDNQARLLAFNADDDAPSYGGRCEDAPCCGCCDLE